MITDIITIKYDTSFLKRERTSPDRKQGQRTPPLEIWERQGISLYSYKQ